mgnify:CR=1 FL=1
MRLLDYIRKHRPDWQGYADTLAESGYGPDSIREEIESIIETTLPIVTERMDEALDWDRVNNERLREFLEERDGKIIARLLDILVNSALSAVSRGARARGTTRAAVRIRISAAPLQRTLTASADVPMRGPVVVSAKTTGGAS